MKVSRINEVLYVLHVKIFEKEKQANGPEIWLTG